MNNFQRLEFCLKFLPDNLSGNILFNKKKQAEPRHEASLDKQLR